MIHAPKKVVTDLIWKEMTPEMAKQAQNMRIGAYDGSYVDDIATIGGTEEIVFTLPEGSNACVGAVETNDKTGIIWANWNSEGDHSFYFLEYKSGTTDLTVTPIPVPNLSFKQDHYPLLADYQEDYNVSINEIDGLLFWNDGPNQQPKKINWTTAYNSPLTDLWEVARITRQPAYALRVVFNDPGTSPTALSNNAFDNIDVPLVGIQWAYTYTRDGNEESRGGPYTEVVWSKDIDLYVPDSEYQYLLVDGTTPNILIKQVNFYFRIGNNGPWLYYDYLDNTLDNYVNESGTLRMKLNIEDMRFIQGSAAINDPFTQVFDAVPLYVRDSLIALNRLFDGNFIEDYNPSNTVAIAISIGSLTPDLLSMSTERRVLHPTDIYTVSVALLDFAGRRSGVESIRTFQTNIPDYHRFQMTNPFAIWTSNPDINNYFTLGDGSVSQFDAQFAQILISGDVPDWCEHVQVCISRSKSTSTFFRTNTFVWLWGEKDGLDYVTFAKISNFGPPPAYVNPSGGVAYKGICLELGSGEPFVFDANENQYVRFIGTVWDDVYFQETTPGEYDYINLDGCDDYNVDVSPYGFKISKQEGSRIFIEMNSAQIARFKKGLWFTDAFSDGMASLHKSYIVDIFSVPNDSDDTFYQCFNGVFTAQQVRDNDANVEWFGDCYLKNTNRTFNIGGVYNLINESGNVLPQSAFMYPSFAWIQFQICTSLQGTFNTNWDSDFGQPNFKNVNQKQMERRGSLQWSDQYLPGTQINGLSSANPLNRKDMPLGQGPINCLRTAISEQSASSVLLAYCYNGVQSNYLGVAQTLDVSGTVVWSATTQVIGQSQPLKGSWGSNRAKQVVSTQNSEVYHYCPAYKDMIQYALDGLNRLGQQNLFLNALKLINNPGRICVGFDPSIQEVVFSGVTGDGLAYNPLYKSFQGYRSYQDNDRFCFVQNTMFSWKDGKLYIHRPTNSDRAFIYGERFDSQFIVVTNPRPAEIKQWESISINGDLFDTIEVINMEGQSTIPNDSFIQRKYRIWKAAIMRNENSDGGTTDGEYMESDYLEVRVAETLGVDVKRINFVEVEGTISIAQ